MVKHISLSVRKWWTEVLKFDQGLKSQLIVEILRQKSERKEFQILFQCLREMNVLYRT